MKNKPTFRDLLFGDDLTFICEAHNAISAKIVEEAGFEGIWASGLTISAQFGLRDNNEASWTQVLDMLEFMSDATTVPILVDGDTGYGNFNNVQLLVRKLNKYGLAAVCIEDKLFPKSNSFINGCGQPLADIDEFSGKIKAAKDAQSDPEFCVIARTEAFTTGQGLADALRRAGAYHQAGADAILIHSALTVPDEVISFQREWGNRCPVVIVPTKYSSTATSVFRENRFSMVIWANQLLRSSIRAMRQVATEIFATQNVTSVEGQIASVDDIFSLQGVDELKEAERRYQPRRSANRHCS